MAIFARRRLQAMLDELSDHVDPPKLLDLVKRIEDKRVKQSLPAEMELALIWAFSRQGDVEVEPEWWEGKRPDIYTESLVPGVPAALEITAPSDGSISGEAEMDAAALRMTEFANTVSRGLGDYLHFTFLEQSGFADGAYVRRRMVPRELLVDDGIGNRIRSWVETGACEREKLRILHGELGVIIEKRKSKQIRHHNFHCSMPPEVYSVDRNPLFELLKEKRRKFRGARFNILRIIIMADAGSTLLNRMGSGSEHDLSGRRISATQIITHFLERHAHEVDVVVVLTSRRARGSFRGGGLTWSMIPVVRHGLDVDLSALDTIIRRLPKPHFEGYQARSLHQQSVFSPQSRGDYVGITMTAWPREGRMQVQFSSRMFLDLLAGRLSEEQFRARMQQGGNLFKHVLDGGKTISGVRFLPGGTDEDDDQIVLMFADDPAARPLRPPADDGQVENVRPGRADPDPPVA